MACSRPSTSPSRTRSRSIRRTMPTDRTLSRRAPTTSMGGGRRRRARDGVERRCRRAISSSTRPMRRSAPAAGAWSPTRAPRAGVASNTREAGAATIDPPLANPVDYVELPVNVAARHELSPLAAAQGRGQLRLQRLGVGPDLRHGRCGRRTGISAGDDVGDAGQPAGLHRLHHQWLGLAGQRLRHGRPRPGAEICHRRRADDQDPGARGWRLDRSDRALAGDVISLVLRARFKTTRPSWRSSLPPPSCCPRALTAENAENAETPNGFSASSAVKCFWTAGPGATPGVLRTVRLDIAQPADDLPP